MLFEAGLFLILASTSECYGHEIGRLSVRDLAYYLLGIFDISILVIYGEGKENALRRLNREWKYQLDELSQTTSNSSKQLGALQRTQIGRASCRERV